MEKSMFWGCIIKYRLPFIEKATQKVAELFDVEFVDNEKHSCCPEPNGIKNANHYLHSLTAARNLSIEKRDKLYVACNGCFETLKASHSEISIDDKLKADIQADLESMNLKFNEKLNIMHLIEFYAREIGIAALKEKVQFPLNGLRVAVHYGCHFLRPSSKIQTDNPLDPHIFDEIIEAIGAQSINYTGKLMCCGGSLSRAEREVEAQAILKHKLDMMVEAGVDAIVVSCPECFLQFDLQQRRLKRRDFVYDIPVFYISELLAIAFGIPPEELSFKYHSIDIGPMFDLIEERLQTNEKIAQNFNLDFLNKCAECRACEDDCPPALIGDFSPLKHVDRLLDGKLGEAVDDPEIWQCLDCYLCYELCPSHIGLVDVFTKLRNMAAKEEKFTEGFQKEYETFLDQQIIGRISKAARKRVGLETIEPDLGDLKEYIEKGEWKNK